jgi:hypothetical protein
MATKKTAAKPEHPKKEFKKELVGKIETALPEIKTKLGEKKFQHRIKKAAKILVHGLHGKDFSANGKTGDAAKASVKKIKHLKRTKKQEPPASS